MNRIYCRTVRAWSGISNVPKSWLVHCFVFRALIRERFPSRQPLVPELASREPHEVDILACQLGAERGSVTILSLGALRMGMDDCRGSSRKTVLASKCRLWALARRPGFSSGIEVFRSGSGAVISWYCMEDIGIFDKERQTSWILMQWAIAAIISIAAVQYTLIRRQKLFSSFRRELRFKIL